MNTLLNRYNTIIWIRLFGELLTSLTNSMIAPFLILYLHQKLDGSVMLPLMIVGLQPFTDIVVTLFAGGITDRIGRKPILLFALFLQMCAMAGFIFADSVWMFASVYIVNGIGRSLYIPAQRAQIADAVSEEHRSEVFALVSTMGYISMSIGPLLGVIMFRYNPIILFILQALALFLYLIVIWLKVPETIPIVRKQIKQTEKEMEKRKTFFLLLLVQFVFTIGESIGLTHLLKFVSVLAPVDQRGRYFSVFGIHWDISRTAGPALGGLVFENFGGQMLFSISATLLLFGMIAQYHVIRIIHRTNILYSETFEHKGV
ncbi:MFS transporter [Aneurinibacillus aneurinilyticus]|uniref:MFS transporter n=1 Tax=Aneurinibacillus aneurinilyticus TaxID=1391 RepID=A0A848CZH4_ANEAE|nr:MFS transporter [Aneurinibacillus aneurinilyticus]NME98932.1 MFS transporter [Aneurinibacillus aneurinilyticus]